MFWNTSVIGTIMIMLYLEVFLQTRSFLVRETLALLEVASAPTQRQRQRRTGSDAMKWNDC